MVLVTGPAKYNRAARPVLPDGISLAAMPFRDTLVLCSGNQGKLIELRAMLPGGIRLLSLTDVGLAGELPETGTTLMENALQKARIVHEQCGLPCLADDTGLEVEALHGAPGVYSARYAGPQRDPGLNMARLLGELQGVAQRSARFRTVLALVDTEGEHTFVGDVQGHIANAPRGENGFGYDPVFVPDGEHRTFAEMDGAEKNRIGHRGRAVSAFVAWLVSGDRPARQ